MSRKMLQGGCIGYWVLVPIAIGMEFGILEVRG